MADGLPEDGTNLRALHECPSANAMIMGAESFIARTCARQALSSAPAYLSAPRPARL